MCTLDDFPVELLALAYEFDRYFPGLLDDARVREDLEAVLPARVAAGRDGLDGARDVRPFEDFLDGLLKGVREDLEEADTLEEAGDAIERATDALYHWLRRYDCVAPEETSVRILMSYVESAVLSWDEATSSWRLPGGQRQDGEGLQEAALRIIAAAGLDLDEGCLREVVSQGYAYDDGALRRIVYMQADCSDQPSLPLRCRACPWESLPREEIDGILRGWRPEMVAVAA
jgi:hypothetical protein